MTAPAAIVGSAVLGFCMLMRNLRQGCDMPEPVVEKKRRLGEVGDRCMRDAVIHAMGPQAALCENVIGACRCAKIRTSVADYDVRAEQLRGGMSAFAIA